MISKIYPIERDSEVFGDVIFPAINQFNLSNGIFGVDNFSKIYEYKTDVIMQKSWWERIDCRIIRKYVDFKIGKPNR